MLLEKQRITNTSLALFLTVILSFFSVYLFSVDMNGRVLILLAIALFSSINIKLAAMAKRIEPISAIYNEYTDQQILYALMDNQGKAKIESEQKKLKEKINSVNPFELPLTHYQFSGTNSEVIRDQISRQMMTRYPKSKMLKPVGQMGSLEVLSEVNERKANPDKVNEPLILLTDSFDPKMSDTMQKLGVYWFVLSDEPTLNIKHKILSNDAIRSGYIPDSDIDIGYFNGSAMKAISTN